MFKLNFIITTAVLSLCCVCQANAALFSQLSGQAVYDADLNITWLADANLASTNTFGVSDINANGAMTWDTANSWITAINANGYLGFDDWRLPTALNQDGSGPCRRFNCTGSEMGHLFYNELSGTAARSVLTSGDPDLALFSNLQAGYWSGTESASFPGNAWNFTFIRGDQFAFSKDEFTFAWAVRSGNVPVPAAMWLFGSGLLGLIGVRFKRGNLK